MVLTARKNLKLYVSDRQREILVGCLLGDAYITKLGKIQIEQCSKQSDYIKWKYQELASISYPNPPKEVIRHEKRDNNRITKSFRFWTRQYFRSWRDKFYIDQQKIFPTDLVTWVTPLSIAVWFMDDGSYDKKYNCIFSTECFNTQSLSVLTRMLQTFGIETTLNKDSISSFRLRIRSKSLNKFFELIRSHIHHSMLYKLP